MLAFISPAQQRSSSVALARAIEHYPDIRSWPVPGSEASGQRLAASKFQHIDTKLHHQFRGDAGLSIRREDGVSICKEAQGTYGVDALEHASDPVPFWFSIQVARLRAVSTHSGTWTLVDQALVSLTNFSTGILVGRFCSKEELGRYMLGYSVILFAMAFQQMLISSPYILIQPRLLEGEAVRNTGGVYTLQFVLGGALMLVLLFTALGFNIAGSRLDVVMLSLAFACPLFLFKEMFRRVCFAHLDVGSALLADLAVGTAQVGLLVALASSGHLSAATGVLAIGVTCGLMTMVWFWWNRHRLVFRIQDARIALRRNWSLGRWIFASQILWALSLYSYPWLISKMHGPAAAGVWAVCFSINALANPLLLGLQNYVEPKISYTFVRRGVHGLRSFVWKATGVLTISMSLFSALILFTGDRVATLVYGAKYAGNGLTIFVLSLSFVTAAAGFALSCGLFASGRGRVELKISCVYPLILCVVGFPLVKIYGPLGAAMGLLVAHSLASVLRALQFLITFQDARGISVTAR